MQIILGAEEQSNVGIHLVDIDEFIKIKDRLKLEVIDLTTQWSTRIKIGSISINLYSDKLKCKYCGEDFQDDINIEYCAII